MNYSHCGSHFGQWSPLSEHTEFDKAARVQITSILIWSRDSFQCKSREVCHLSTILFWNSSAGSKQHSQVQCVQSELLQSM